MSFARDLKEELARIDPGKDCCRRAELYALSLLLAKCTVRDEEHVDVVYTCDSPATARKIYLILKSLYEIKPRVKLRELKRFTLKRVFLVNCEGLARSHPLVVEMGLEVRKGFVNFNSGLIAHNCCRRAFLRGVFISKGYINRPEGVYHLELLLPDPELARPVQKSTARFGLDMRCVDRKNQSVLYLKDSEAIGDFLRLIGASKAVLDFENARIVKYIRNTVNRQVNCETANVNKTIEAAVRQNSLIENLVAKIGVERLPDDLQELALLRLEFPEESLRELGSKMDPPLSKSGVAYRMRKLESYASQVLDQ